MGVLEDFEGFEGSSVHTTHAQGELQTASELLDWKHETDFWLLPFPLVLSSLPVSLLVPPRLSIPLVVLPRFAVSPLVPLSPPSIANSPLPVPKHQPSLPLPLLSSSASCPSLELLKTENPSAHPQHVSAFGSFEPLDLQPSTTPEDPMSPPLQDPDLISVH